MVRRKSGTDVVGVDERPGVVTRGFGAAPLLRPQRLRRRRETRNLELELAPIARRKFLWLGIEWLTGNRAHRSRLLPIPKRVSGVVVVGRHGSPDSRAGLAVAVRPRMAARRR